MSQECFLRFSCHCLSLFPCHNTLNENSSSVISIISISEGFEVKGLARSPVSQVFLVLVLNSFYLLKNIRFYMVPVLPPLQYFQLCSQKMEQFICFVRVMFQFWNRKNRKERNRFDNAHCYQLLMVTKLKVNL